MNEELFEELREVEQDALLIWHDVQGSKNKEKEISIQKIWIDEDKKEILLIGNEFVFNERKNRNPRAAKVQDVVKFLEHSIESRLIWHNVKTSEEFEITDWHYDKGYNEFLFIGNDYPKREGESLSDIIEKNPEEYPLLSSMLHKCDCKKCSSGRSCLGPARPLKQEVLDKMKREAPRDDGPCENCGDHITYFAFTYAGYKCPNCGGPESGIDWYYHLKEETKDSKPDPKYQWRINSEKLKSTVKDMLK